MRQSVATPSWWIVVGVVVALLGCGPGEEPDGGPGSAVAVFDPPAEGSIDFWALPFPSDLFRGEDGAVEIGSFSNATESVEQLCATINTTIDDYQDHDAFDDVTLLLLRRLQ